MTKRKGRRGKKDDGIMAVFGIGSLVTLILIAIVILLGYNTKFLKDIYDRIKQSTSIEGMKNIAKSVDCNNNYKDQNSCNNNPACVWCTSKYVPDECLTVEQAKQVPPGVFRCDN